MQPVPSRNSSTSRKNLAQFRKDFFYFERFVAELFKVRTFQESVELIRKHALKNQPGDRYYVHLSVLVYTCSIPEEAKWEERLLYIELIRRWKIHSPDMFMPGALDRLERSLLGSTEESLIH